MFSHCLVQLALRLECLGEIFARHREMRHAGQRALKLRNRLIRLALFVERRAEIVVGLGIVGFERDGLAITDGSVIQLALGFERIAKIVMRFGMVGLEGEGPTITAHRLIELSLRFEHETQGAIVLGGLRVEDDGAVNDIDCEIGAPPLIG